MPNGVKRQGRSSDQRTKLLHILEYLLENTDENHFVKNADIKTYLSNRGINADQRTIVSDIKTLQDYGYEVEYDYREKAYHIISRDFELYQLQLLIDSVQSSKFIPQKEAKELSNKIKKLASRNDRILLERRNYVANRVRSLNDSVFYHIEDVHAAIADGWQLSFHYFTYDLQKNKRYYKHCFLVFRGVKWR